MKHQQILSGIGNRGTEDGQFSNPHRFSLSKDGHIVIPDRNNNRIQILTDDGAFVRKFGLEGGEDGEMRLPEAVEINHDTGLIFVTDQGNNRVQVFTFEGNFVRKFGSAGSENGQLAYPVGISISQCSGHVYVVEFGNKRVQVFTQEGEFVKIIGAGELQGPFDLALDEEDNVFVTDSSNETFVFDKEGALTSKLGAGIILDPFAIHVDQERGHILVGGRNGIHVFNKRDGSLVQSLKDRTFVTAGVAADSQGRIIATNVDAHTVERWA